MAFKGIDWDAIMNKTPEQRAEERETAAAEFEAKILRQIDERKAKVTALLANVDAIPEKDIKFVRSLETKSTMYCMSGYMGGLLTDLSEKQVAYLDGLHRKYCIQKTS